MCLPRWGLYGPPVESPGGFQEGHPVPLIAFYGTANPIVKSDGGTANTTLITRLARLPGPPGDFLAGQTVDQVGPGATTAARSRSLYRHAGMPIASATRAASQRPRLCSTPLPVGGAAWPGGAPIPVGKTSHSIDATAEMWRFFKAHALSGEELEAACPDLAGPGRKG